MSTHLIFLLFLLMPQTVPQGTIGGGEVGNDAVEGVSLEFTSTCQETTEALWTDGGYQDTPPLDVQSDETETGHFCDVWGYNEYYDRRDNP